MRKYLYLVLDSPDEDTIGNVEVHDTPKTTMAEKNQPGPTHIRDLETGETWTEQHVGLGYYDFEDEADYEENIFDVMRTKLREIDQDHLDDAGVEL